MPDMDKFEYESIEDRQSIRNYLKTLVEGLEKRRIVFADEKDNVMLIPAELIRFSIKSRKKSGKSKLTIKLAWNDSTIEQSSEKCDAIQIAS